MAGDGLFDPGLQPERTELAWRRTVLSLLVAALVALRLLPPALGDWSLVTTVIGLLLTVVLWILARRRARLVRRALQDARELPGAGLLLFLAMLLSGGALLALAYVASG